MQFTWTVALLFIAFASIWMALALYFSARSRLVGIGFAFSIVVLVSGLFFLGAEFPWALGVWCLLFASIFVWYRVRKPQQDRDWVMNMAVLPRVQREGDQITIRDFRHFDYDAAGAPLPRYEQRIFDLAKLESLDFFLCRLSGQFLAVSVEARREKRQTYSPLGGMFRIYELMVVLGDERDLVRVRTNIAKVSVKRYRVNLSPEYLRQLLMDYLERAESLVKRPEWYHSVMSNCTTNLVYRRFRQVPWRLKWGVFINGLSARSLFRLGLLEKGRTFREIEAQSEIRDLALAAGNAPDFSQRIRKPS
jgi:Domain of unknown function (DUF4105)